MTTFNRRQFLQTLGACSAAVMLPRAAVAGVSAEAGTSEAGWLMPEEGEAHAATWMAYGATAAAWGTRGVFGASRAVARGDLLRIAANISRFEPVNMLVNDEKDRAEAQVRLAEITAQLNRGRHDVYAADNVFSNGKKLPEIGAGGKVNFILCPLNDLWARDTAPVFVRNAQGKPGAVDFNFNGWGQENTGAKGWRKDPEKAENGILEQPVAADRRVAAFITRKSGVPAVKTWLVMEGGGIEVNGAGTAICTESCILNANRNPNRSKAEVEAELRRVLGVKKVIWLKGRKAKDITDGHIDFYARFIGENTVAYALEGDSESPDYEVTRENEKMLQQATTAEGKPLKLVPLHAPDFAAVEKAVGQRQWPNGKSYYHADSFAGGYIGYYAGEKFVLMAQFGDEEADKAAFDAVQKLHPNHTVMQIATDGLANGGGTIHCATQQQPA